MDSMAIVPNTDVSIPANRCTPLHDGVNHECVSADNGVESANESLRKRLMEIENKVIGALHHQPDDQAKCFEYLSSVLERIHELSSVENNGLDKMKQ